MLTAELGRWEGKQVVHFSRRPTISLSLLLGNMEIDLLPPRIQRFRLKLTSYQFKVLYVPGKLLATAYTLSRAPVNTPSLQADQVELYVQELIHSLPGLISP